MKKLCKANVAIALCFLLIACGQVSYITPVLGTTPFPTVTLAPSQTPEIPIESTPTTYVPPTLIPTINPEFVPNLLGKAISLQTLVDVNGHSIQKITGWEYGFRQEPCDGYQWLDSNHLLLYPRTGQEQDGFHLGKIDLSSELVVINLTDGSFWLQEPLSSTPFSFWGLDCNGIYWSQELGIIIDQQMYGTVTGPSKEAVFIHTFDGKEIARYWGKILGVSPSGEKILVDEDTIIDLRTDKITDLAWHMDYDLTGTSKLYWSSDESRVYQCCFYYADLKTVESYNLEWNNLRDKDGKPISFSLKSPHVGGRWVRNDTYFFPLWDYMSYAGDPTLIFSPTEKKYDVIEVPSTSFINPETFTYNISPDGMYVWIKGYSEVDGAYHNFLVNLYTFETTAYDTPVNDFVWSPDSKFAWMTIYDSSDKYILSADKTTLTLFPAQPTSNLFWHPTNPVLAFLTEKNQVLTILNAKDMSVKGWTLPTTFYDLIWSPDGDYIAFVATDGSLWQVDYPKLENFEQLTEPMPSGGIQWSPDGNSIAFISGSDIYIVDTMK